MISERLKKGEIAVIGLGRSGRAAAILLAQRGATVYASDMGTTPDILESAKLLEDRGIMTTVGGHDLSRWPKVSLVVASPGVPPDAAPLAVARASGIPIVSEIEVALDAMPDARVIAITGTNGKTTTTALTAHLLSAMGLDAVAAGNIGTPLSAFAVKRQRPSWYALEMSSFQLHDTPSLNPLVGVLTNLTPDHLDRYATVEEYYADKARLFANASAASKWVWNADSERVRAMTTGVAGAHNTFSIGTTEGETTEGETTRSETTKSETTRSETTRSETAKSEGWFDREGNRLMLFGEPLLDRKELTLLGDHNVANALAASLAVMVAEPGHRLPVMRQRIADGLRTFRALAHRLEVVGEFGGVVWINDSKATNVDSAKVAIAGMTRPTVLLLGGRHKGEPYTALAREISGHVKAVVAYGEAGPKVEQDLKDVVPVELLGSSFETVVARARALAAPGDAVLLSPACSSYDMFNNYEERGAEFRRLASAQ